MAKRTKKDSTVIVRRLASSPRNLALLYLGIIPAFGLLYCCLPGDFYHSTSQFEEERNADRAKVALGLSNALQAQASRVRNETKGRRNVLVKDVRVSGASVSLDNNTLKFTLRVSEIAMGKGRIDFTMPASINVWERIVTFPSNAANLPSMAREQSVEADPRGQYYYFLAYDAAMTKALGPYFDSAMLTPSEERFGGPIVMADTFAADSIYRYYFAMNGRPGMGRAWSLDQIVRMLYFSASSITTTGYGDIVPLTTRARALAMSESVLGIILIGLFLNALAQRISTQSQTKL